MTRPGLGKRLRGLLPMPITHVVVDHLDNDQVAGRRRKVVAGTALIGASLLGAGLSAKPGSRAFYRLTFAVAGTWAVGGVASGPLHLGWIQGRDSMLRRPLVTPIATGVGAFAVFYGCALASRRLPFLDRAISRVMEFADEGEDGPVFATTLANGLGEEIFFRGALFAALPSRHAVVGSTAVYTLTTTGTRNPALVLAATVMGALFGLQRRASGGIQAPILTHLTWSALMVRFLPPLFRGRRLEARSDLYK